MGSLSPVETCGNTIKFKSNHPFLCKVCFLSSLLVFMTWSWLILMQCVSRVKGRSWKCPVLMLFAYETSGKKIMPRFWDKNETNIACYALGVQCTHQRTLLWWKDKSQNTNARISCYSLAGLTLKERCMCGNQMLAAHKKFRDLCLKIQEQSVTVFWII